MIKTQNLVPEIYYNRSRDFQLIGRLYDIILNHMKNNSEAINNIPYCYPSDKNLLDLLCTTLGFNVVHEYNNEQLAKLCSIYIEAVRNKGSKKALKLILNMLISIAGGTQEAVIDQDEDGTLYLYIPAEVTDLTLFKDVLKYLIPTGVSYNIINSSAELGTVETKIAFKEDTSSVTGTVLKTKESFLYAQLPRVVQSGTTTKLNVYDESSGGEVDYQAPNSIQIPSDDSSWSKMSATDKTGTPQSGAVPGTTDNVVIPRFPQKDE